MPEVNVNAYQKSITAELDLIKNRVRNLIGSANWAEEGRYKEAILKKAIAQFLPSNLTIATGFIVFNSDHTAGANGMISSQLDLIVYDNRSPVVFKEGDFVIVTDSMVKAVIEVKSKVINYGEDSKNALNNIIVRLNDLLVFPSFENQTVHGKKFVGIFSFEYQDNSFLAATVDSALQSANGLVNHISLGPNKFIRYWEDTTELIPPLETNGRCYFRYNLNGLSFSYFISNLLHIVSENDPVDRYWFSFPIEGTKETLRVGKPTWL